MMRRLAIALTFGLLGLGTPPAAAQLTIDAPTIVIDKTSKGGSAVIYVHNVSDAPVKRTLRVRGFSMGKDLPALDAKTTLAAPGATTKDVKDEFVANVPPRGAVAVRVDVTNFNEAGPATATVLGDAHTIGDIKAVRYDVPFAVKLEGTPAERPEITFQSLPRGVASGLWRALTSAFSRDGDRPAPETGPRRVRLTVKNDDPLTYPVDWEVVVNDVPVKGTATLTKSGQTEIEVQPSSAWFGGPASYLKDDLQDGKLLLRFRPSDILPSHAQASKELPLRVRLRSGSVLRQTVIGTVVVALLVLLGGLSSLLLRFWVPNRVAGIDVQERLKTIADRTRALSSDSLDSSVRVLVRVQRHRLAELATSRLPFSPDWSTTLADCTRRIGLLSRQLDLLEAIDRLADKVQRLRVDLVAPAPPTLLDAVQTHFTTATEKLRAAEPTDVDLQAAQTALGDAEALLHVMDKLNSTFEAEIVDRFTSFQPSSSGIPPGDATMARITKGLRLAAALTQPVPVVGTILIKRYTDLDRTSLRLDLLIKYVKLFNGSSSTVQGALQSTPDGPELRFLRSLDVDGWEDFRDARFILAQMVETLFVQDVVTDLTKREIDIDAWPAGASPYEPVRFRAWFRGDRVGRCTARQQVICHWKFIHDEGSDGGSVWEENGWEVWHYFPVDGLHRVEATFRDKTTGAEITPADKVVLKKEYRVRSQRSALFGERTRLELVRFAIVFGATLLGLLAGARDQLTKLDLVGGIIAVFLLGFSADAIKNLLTGK